MKTIQKFTCAIATACLAVALFSGCSAEEKKAALPYTLKTCAVTDEVIDDKGDMKPYSFVHEGREIKLCCKSCLKDFNKDSAKYVKKIEAAEKAAK
jgi:hypothetical protein